MCVKVLVKIMGKQTSAARNAMRFNADKAYIKKSNEFRER